MISALIFLKHPLRTVQRNKEIAEVQKLFIPNLQQEYSQGEYHRNAVGNNNGRIPEHPTVNEPTDNSGIKYGIHKQRDVFGMS